MKQVSLVGLLALALAMAGCSKKNEEATGGEGVAEGEVAGKAAEKGAKLDPGQEFALDRMKVALAAIKEGLNKGERVGSRCAAAEGYGKTLQGVEDPEVTALIAEVVEICGYDVPLAAAEKAVKAAEEARAAKPDKKVLMECFDAYYTMAMETLAKEHADDPKVTGLQERFAKVCPPKK